MVAYREAPTYEISFLYRKILVPVDGSESSLRALDLAIDLARHYGSKITVLYVKTKGYKPSFNPLERAKNRIEEKGLSAEYKEKEVDPAIESTAKGILDELAEGGYDMIVLGARGRTISSELTIGSKALTIAINAPVTVVIVR